MDIKIQVLQVSKTLSFIFGLLILGQGTPWKVLLLVGFHDASSSKILPSFILHLVCIAFSPTSEALKRESTPQWGSCSDVKQMKSENHGHYLPGCQLFPKLYLVQEDNSATRVPLGLSIAERHNSQNEVDSVKTYTIPPKPMGWLSHIKGSFLWASSNNFLSPPLTAHLPLPSPPPLVWISFCTCPQLYQCLGSALPGEGSPLLQQHPSSSMAWGRRMEGNLKSSNGELVWRLLFSFCLLVW